MVLTIKPLRHICIVAILCGAFVLTQCGISSSQTESATAPSIAIPVTPSAEEQKIEQTTRLPVPIEQTAQAIQPLGSPRSFDTNWQKQWLQDATCRAPCWQGIIPGQTSFDIAVAVLKSKSFIGKMIFTPAKIKADADLFGWDYIDGKGSGYAEYETLTPNHTIIAISAGFTDDILLREIIAVYGMPTHVIATGKAVRFDDGTIHPEYFFALVYLEKGFLVATNITSTNTMLNEDLHMTGLTFFVPTLSTLKGTISEVRDYPQTFQPWQGFQPFHFYCRPTDQSLACDEPVSSTPVQ